MQEPDNVWNALEREFGNKKSTEPLGTSPEEDKPPEKIEPLLRIRTANQCIRDAKLKPIPRMLLGELWHEGELTILFADTNLGKSIFTVQGADNITRNHSPPWLRMDAGKQIALYLDFELSDKQFQQRYSQEFDNEYPFDNGFYRVEINPEFADFTDFENSLKAGIEKALLDTGAKILIVDNLTYLKTQSTDTAKEALPLMKFLKELKSKHELSILALAHTPKRDNTRPLTVNDLAGSKHLSNFADSIFAIGESAKDPELRYIKQIKARATAKIYDSDNVIVCRVVKPFNFLHFEFEDYGYESEHLKVRSENYHQELDAQIIAIKEANPTITDVAISRQLNVNKIKVGRALKRHAESKGTETP